MTGGMTGRMTEPREIRLRRLKMRAWRRGMKETDLILGGFADAHLASMPDSGLEAFEALLAENDQEILAWVTGAETPPEDHAALVAGLRSYFGSGPVRTT